MTIIQAGRSIVLGLAFGAAGLVATASAQKLPEQVRILVPFTPGGAADTGVRIVSQWINQNGGPQMVVENRPGGASAVALNAVKTSQPDGSVIGVCESGAMSSNTWLFKSLSYDPQKDFAPITTYVSVPIALAVPGTMPVNSMKELVQFARESGRELSYGSQAVGASGHLLGAYFAKLGNFKAVHVPFRGSAPALNELVAGRLDYFWTSFPSLKGFYENGQIKVLALGSAQRDPAFPKVPTTGEEGFPQLAIDFWFGLCAPAGTPAAIVNELHARIAKALQSEDVRKQYQAVGMQVHSTTPEQFRKLIVDDTARFKEIVESTGAKLD
ncbi:MAG: Bug family tripartite tricarboxylate transporter substrate binding protein [Pseudomonadota bacterium]